MKTKVGILYSLTHFSWFQYKKCGRTSQSIKKRISNMQTSLLGNIDIIYTTNTLIDCYFYEYLMKQILKNYRINTKKEMFFVDEFDIKMIFDFIDELNFKFNTEEKLNWYIQNYHLDYYKKRKYVKKDHLNEKKMKKKKVLFVDTTY